MFGSEKYRSFLRHPGCNGGGGGQTSTTTQKADPWSGVQPYLLEGYSRASNLYAPGQGPDLYPNQMYVSNDPLTTQSRQMIQDYASTQMPQDVNAVRGGYGTLLGAADVNNNPYLAQAASGAIRPITEQLTEQILPNIRGGAVQTGQYGGSRQALAEGTAIGKAVQAMGDVTSNMYSNAYQQGLGTVGNAVGMAPQMLALSQAPAQTFGELGKLSEADAQKALQEDMYRWEFAQKQPYSQLSDYLQLLQGASPYGSQVSTQSQPGNTNNAMGALGSLAMLAGPFMFGGFSDERVKTDIHRVGTTDEGLPVYTFRYKTGGPVQMGVMAQDVEKVKPEAVAEFNGVKMVNYSMIG